MGIPSALAIDTDLDIVKTPGFYFCNGAENENRPDDSGSFSLLVEKTGAWEGKGVKQTYTGFSTGITYTRVFQGYDETTWEEWKQLATATPPQEFDLPLVEGVQNVSSAYWKDQFGVVTGFFNILANSVQSGYDITIGTLPEGFRPSRLAHSVGVVSSGESLGLLVRQTGEIQLQDAASVTLEGKYIKGLFSFVAAS